MSDNGTYGIRLGWPGMDSFCCICRLPAVGVRTWVGNLGSLEIAATDLEEKTDKRIDIRLQYRGLFCFPGE